MIASMLAGGLGFLGGQAAADQADWAADQGVYVRSLNRADTSPWRASGAGAVNQLTRLLGLGNIRYTPDSRGLPQGELDASNAVQDQQQAFGEWQRDPGYQWRMSEGIRARDRSAASKGMLLSGAQRKALDNWGQGLASEEYGNYFNRLAAMAGAGSQAVGQSGNVAASTLGPISQSAISAGQSRQSAYNALASGVIRADNNAQKWASRIWGGGMWG